MSDAIIRMLGRPRLTVAGHALSPHAYVLRMFLGEVPTLTVEVASGASTGPDIVANAGLEDVAAQPGGEIRRQLRGHAAHDRVQHLRRAAVRQHRGRGIDASDTGPGHE